MIILHIISLLTTSLIFLIYHFFPPLYLQPLHHPSSDIPSSLPLCHHLLVYLIIIFHIISLLTTSLIFLIHHFFPSPIPTTSPPPILPIVSATIRHPIIPAFMSSSACLFNDHSPHHIPTNH